MKQNKKAEQQLIAALNRLQGVTFTDTLDGIAVGSLAASPQERYFSFNVANYAFAIKASHFCEVFVEPAITPLPNAPDLLMGLCNVRGILVPVYQLHGLLQHDVPAHRTVFCIGKGEHTVGILTDNLPSSVNLPEIASGKLTDALPDFVKALVLAEAQQDNKNYLLLDGDRVAEQLLMLSLKLPAATATAEKTRAPVFY